MTKTVFYAWQSDSPSKTNRNFIERELGHAIKLLNRTDTMLELNMDRDTAGETYRSVMNQIREKYPKVDIGETDRQSAREYEEYYRDAEGDRVGL